MQSSSKLQKRHLGFTLIELLVVMAILAIMTGLLLSAVQKVRDAAARMKCQNNLKQIGLAFLNFESTYGKFPRSGEHLVGSARTQCFQSPLTMILPYLEQDAAYRQIDLRYRHNEGPNALIAASGGGPGAIVPAYNCPTNPLRSQPRDSQNYGYTDYAPLPYVEIAGTRHPAALTSGAYPLGYYQTYTGYAATAFINPAKAYQLRPSSEIGGIIDPFYAAGTLAAISDGTSNTILVYEDVGRDEWMNGDPQASGLQPNNYLDPVTLAGRAHWRWAEPDSTSGCSRGINNNPWPLRGTPSLPWTAHDVGPNNEWFSFHSGGANALFADGSVRFVRDSVSIAVVQALGTRAGGEVVDIE